MAPVRVCARVIAVLSCLFGLMPADYSVAGESAPSDAKVDLPTLFEQRFPEVMNATLIERDCPGFRSEAERELSYYVDAFIHFASDKPELAGGVDAVYRAGETYDKQHYAAGASFCGKFAGDIVDKGLESARVMAPEVGVAPYNSSEVDVPGLEKSLETASGLLGAADKCREVKRDTFAGVNGRFGGFMFFSSTIAETRADFAALEAFAMEKGAADDLRERLEKLAKEGHDAGPEECSLNTYVTLGSDLDALVKRYGLTP